jgi:hypothetical protein
MIKNILYASDARLATVGGSSGLLLIVSVIALLLAAGMIMSTTTALLELIRSLIAEVFYSVGRLLLIGSCLVCLVLIFLTSGSSPAGGAE